MAIFKPPFATTAERSGLTLELGEFVFDTDLQEFYQGDGTTVGGKPFLIGDTGIQGIQGIQGVAGPLPSDAEVKTAYENNASTNEFNDAEKTKLSGVELNATADQTGAEIKTAYENNANTNAFTDAEQTKLSSIETNATSDQTGAEIKSLYEAEASAFTDSQFTKLSSIETNATADQLASEVPVVATGFTGNLSGTDTDAQTALNTIDSLSLGGGGTALSTTADTTNFAGNLSTADTDVQKALDTIDNLTLGGSDAPSSGYSGTSDKTASYTVLIGDASTKINLTTGASADATFTLPTASLTDQMRFFFRNENAFATYRLSISDGTDDIWHIGVDDGVLEIYYDADVGDWSEA